VIAGLALSPHAGFLGAGASVLLAAAETFSRSAVLLVAAPPDEGALATALFCGAGGAR